MKHNKLRHMDKKYLFVLLFCFSISNIFAQITLKGSICDESGKAISYANIVLFNEKDSSFVAGGISNDVGEFSLKELSPYIYYILKVSSLGYQPYYNKIKGGDIGKIVLKEAPELLNEVVVKGHKPVYTMQNNGINVDVAHSILSKEVRMLDMLGKIPLVLVQNKSVQVIGKSGVSYYINERQVSDFSEIENLSVDEVKSVTVITSPNAKYGTSNQAVIQIKTKNRNDGLSYDVHLNVQQGRKFNRNELINMGYQQDKLYVYGSYNYSDERQRTREEGGYDMLTDTVWTMHEKSLSSSHPTSHWMNTGFDYAINVNNKIGVKYLGQFSRTSKDANRQFTAQNDKNELQSVLSDEYSLLHGTNHHLSFYYNGTWSKNLNFNLYADYVRQKTNSNGAFDEQDTETGRTNYLFDSHTSWRVFALKADLDYQTQIGNFSVGGNYSRTKGYNLINNVRVLNNGRSNNTEQRYSAFVMYDRSFGELSLNAGLRFESWQPDIKDQTGKNNISKTYLYWYPSFSLSYFHNNMQQMLNYSFETDKPIYDDLNNNTVYTDRFHCTKGNMDLRSSWSHNINYMLMYKFIVFSLLYNYTHDLISSTFYPYSGRSYVMVTTPYNYRKSQSIIGSLNIQYPIKQWTPSVGITCYKSIFKYTDMYGETSEAKTPFIILNLGSNLNLPHDWMLSMNYNYSSKGDLTFIQSKPYSYLNLNVQKSFCKNNLVVSLDAYDVFNQNNIKSIVQSNKIRMNAFTKDDTRKLGLTLIYKFRQKDRSPKSNAVNEELKRLKINER